jgi:tetratricopeptide (TPR) repeat protein
MNAGLETYRLTGSGINTGVFAMLMAEAQLQAGRPDEALSAVLSALSFAQKWEDRASEPQLHQLQGEILLMQGDEETGEACIRRAIECSRSMQAKMLEARAAIALAKLLRQQGRTDEAFELLQPLNDWFEEGRNTPELIELSAILRSLDAPQGAAIERASS